MDLSIIIPAFKSKEILFQQLPILLKWIPLWKYATEVIVVVDGEDVNDYKEKLNHPSLIITGYEVNKGKGFAIKHGFTLSTASVIIFTDADIPFSEKSMLEMANRLHQNTKKALWVIGDRTLPGSVYFDHIPWIRKAGSNFFLLIIKLTLGQGFEDTQCGLKGFTRVAGDMVLVKSAINRFAFDFECLYIANYLKIKVIKIPVVLRNQSASTVRIYRDGVKLLKDVLKVIFFYKYD